MAPPPLPPLPPTPISRRSSEASGRHESRPSLPDGPLNRRESADRYRPAYLKPATKDVDLNLLLNDFSKNLYEEFLASFNVEKADRVLSFQQKKADDTRRTSSSFPPLTESAEKAVALAKADADEARRCAKESESNRVSVVSKIADGFHFNQANSEPVSDLRIEFDALGKAHENEKLEWQKDKLEFQNEIKRLRQNDSDFRNELAELQKAQKGAAGTESKAKELESDLQNAHSTIQSLKHKLDEQAADIGRLKENDEFALDKLAHVEAEHEAFIDQSTECEAAVRRVEQKEASMTSQVNGFQQGKADLSGLQRAISEMPSKDDVKQQVEELKVQVDTKMSFAQICDNITRCKTEILEVLNPQQDVFAKEILHELDLRESTMNEKVNSLKAGTQDSLDAFSGSFHQQTAESGKLRAVVDGVSEQLQSLRQAVNFLDDRYNSVTTQDVVQAMCLQMQRIYPHESLVRRAELDEFRKSHNKIHPEIDKIPQHAESINQMQKFMTTNFGLISQNSQALANEINKNSNTYNTAYKYIHDRLNGLGESARKLEQQQTSIDVNVQTVDDKVKSQLPDLERRIQDANDLILAKAEGLQTETRDIKDNQRQMECKISSQAHIETLESECKKVASRILELDEHKSHIDGLKDKVLDLEEHDTLLDTRLDECQAKILWQMGQVRSAHNVDSKRQVALDLQQQNGPVTPPEASSNDVGRDTIDLTENASPAHSTRQALSYKRRLHETGEASPVPSSHVKRKKKKVKARASSPFSGSLED